MILSTLKTRIMAPGRPLRITIFTIAILTFLYILIISPAGQGHDPNTPDVRYGNTVVNSLSGLAQGAASKGAAGWDVLTSGTVGGWGMVKGGLGWSGRKAGVTHVVEFGFSKNVRREVVLDIAGKLLALAENCIHPVTQKPYIRSAKGGRDNSHEGLQSGLTHVFIFEFDNVEDRDYYVNKDPAHQRFKGTMADIVDSVIVMDFEAGMF